MPVRLRLQTLFSQYLWQERNTLQDFISFHVTGYEGRTNTLNLFDLDTVDESVIGEGISFDKKDIAKT